MQVCVYVLHTHTHLRGNTRGTIEGDDARLPTANVKKMKKIRSKNGIKVKGSKEDTGERKVRREDVIKQGKYSKDMRILLTKIK